MSDEPVAGETSARMIRVRGAREHNLKSIDLDIPRDKLVVVTGVSGSGKSSLAFDTIFAEGQRRYVESLSAYARQFLEQMEKPEVESIDGLSPAIAIEQRSSSRNPRSTVGTVTEIYDYLRLLFARVGHPHCPSCGREIASRSPQAIADLVLALPSGTRVQVLAPVVRGRKGEHRKEIERLRGEGFTRVRVDGETRRLEEKIALDKARSHTIEVVVDRLEVGPGVVHRLTESIETALRYGQGLVKVAVEGGEETLYSEQFACAECGLSIPELTPRLFSFNSPYGACPRCDGLGEKLVADPDRIVPDPRRSIQEGAIAAWEGRARGFHKGMLMALARHYGFDLFTPWEKLPEKVRRTVLYGSGEEEIHFELEHGESRHSFRKRFEGVIRTLEERYARAEDEDDLEELKRFMKVATCPECGGTRLRRESASVRVAGRTIVEFTRLSVRDALAVFRELRVAAREAEIADRILKEIVQRIEFLSQVGLDYLTLDRSAATLAGGEAQRIRLATQIGSGLMGVLYILDEPSIGLHPRDNSRLIATLKRLRDLGNTVLVAEHDPETILEADWVIELGPGAGERGGQVVAVGTPSAILANQRSLTGSYLSGARAIPTPALRRKPQPDRSLVLKGARKNNLKNLTVRIPLGLFTCVTGVSGSGKSTLAMDTLYPCLHHKLLGSRDPPEGIAGIEGAEHIDKAVEVTQEPIGRTPRSNPATYTGLFAPIRELFAGLPEARMRGWGPGRFSFNVKGGRCEACGGDGVLKIEMHFLPDLHVTCETCHGRRYNRETLEVRFKGKSIADALDLTVDQALELFSAIPQVREKLKTLSDVGLGYIRLGQSATTLSGGEAQRIKLARELGRRQTGRTFYILDEPTTGLHFADVEQLLEVLGRLVDAGNTVVVIEHNLEVVKTADHVIDLGPEGGDAGGRIVAEGPPELVARTPGSHTGHYLKRALGSRARQA